MTQAFPLQWPDGWPRTPTEQKQDSKYRFKKQRWNSSQSPYWTFAEARDALIDELDRMGARSAVLSSNYETRLDGLPRAGGPIPDDTGVAVYFDLGGRPMVMACDRHIRAEENMRSIALALEAMRQLERHGGGVMMEKAFSGFVALPAPKAWHQVLGVSPAASRDEIERAFRILAKTAHPDAGGSNTAMAELNDARRQGLEAAGASKEGDAR